MDNQKYGFERMNISDERVADAYEMTGRELALIVLQSTSIGNLSSILMNEEYIEATSRYSDIMKQMKCKYALILWNEQEEERMLFLSENERIRALEFLDYILADFGLIRGNVSCASGQIASAILSVQMSGDDITEVAEYFMKQTLSYYEDCDWIDAKEYGMTHELEISELPRYKKKKIAWAYVKSTDVVEEGKEFIIKSLENESGLRIVSSPEAYIMIGCRGEIYDISREKFEKTYEASEEILDVFEKMFDYFPEAELVSAEALSLDERYVCLDEIAHLCYPRQGLGIAAKVIDKRTKIFPATKDQEYFLGRKGDYMAIRGDDFCDVYIIQRDIFEETYEKANDFR